MHPIGPADAGMIIVPHADFKRIKLKRRQHKIVAALDVCSRNFDTFSIDKSSTKLLYYSKL